MVGVNEELDDVSPVWLIDAVDSPPSPVCHTFRKEESRRIPFANLKSIRVVATSLLSNLHVSAVALKVQSVLVRGMLSQ